MYFVKESRRDLWQLGHEGRPPKIASGFLAAGRILSKRRFNPWTRLQKAQRRELHDRRVTAGKTAMRDITPERLPTRLAPQLDARVPAFVPKTKASRPPVRPAPNQAATSSSFSSHPYAPGNLVPDAYVQGILRPEYRRPWVMESFGGGVIEEKRVQAEPVPPRFPAPPLPVPAYAPVIVDVSTVKKLDGGNQFWSMNANGAFSGSKKSGKKKEKKQKSTQGATMQNSHNQGTSTQRGPTVPRSGRS